MMTVNEGIYSYHNFSTGQADSGPQEPEDWANYLLHPNTAESELEIEVATCAQSLFKILALEAKRDGEWSMQTATEIAKGIMLTLANNSGK